MFEITIHVDYFDKLSTYQLIYCLPSADYRCELSKLTQGQNMNMIGKRNVVKFK